MGDRAYHKYIKKIPIGGGTFRYIYDEASKVGNGIRNTAGRGFNAAGHGLTQFGRGAANTAGRAWNATSRGARNLGRKIDVGVGIGPYNRYKKSARNLKNARSLGDRMKYAGEALAYGSQAKRSMLGRANSGLNAAGKDLTRFGKGASKNIRKGWNSATDAAGKGLNAAGKDLTRFGKGAADVTGKGLNTVRRGFSDTFIRDSSKPKKYVGKHGGGMSFDSRPKALKGLDAAGKSFTRFGKGAAGTIGKGWDSATDAAGKGLNAAGKGLTRFGKGTSKNIRKGWDGATDIAGKGLNAAGKGLTSAGRGVTSTASSGVKAAGKSIDAGKRMIEGWLGFNRKKRR